MTDLLISPQNRSDYMYRNLFINRKKMKLTAFDLSLFGYLLYLSRTRIFIKITTARLSEDIHEPYLKVLTSLKKFIQLDLLRRIKFKNDSGIMITPLFINNGDIKRKTFKVKLWAENSFTIQEHS